LLQPTVYPPASLSAAVERSGFGGDGLQKPETEGNEPTPWENNTDSNMKNVLRWLAVLPGAVAASIVVQFINALLNSFVLDILMQWWNSWAGTFVLIFAGVYIAPSHKFITAIILTVLYAVFIGAMLAAGFLSKLQSTPLWNLIVCAGISLFAAVISCLLAKEMEDARVREQQAQRESD
jgi:hypothetical protein